MKTKSKRLTLASIHKRFSDRIKWVSDETDEDNGYWACLSGDWRDRDGMTGVHSMSLEALVMELDDCREMV